jgi:hypothetical protein
VREVHSPASLVASARRARAAGAALWREGLVAESQAQLDQALRVALRTWAPAGDEQEALVALDRAGYRGLARLQAALAVRPPVATEGAFDLTSGEAERLVRFSVRRHRSPGARRRRRWLAAGGLAAAMVLAGVVAGRLWLRPRASASAVYASEFAVANALDGEDETEWLLPDQQDGWLQIVFPWSRRVHGVELVNAHNRTYHDRGAKEVRVTAFSDYQPLASATGTFAAAPGDRSTLQLPLEARGVTHLRVEVLSHFGRSGGLADVRVR